MSEEDEFDVELFIPYLLAQASEASSLAFQQEYKERYGMLRTEWRVLFQLGLYGIMTAQDICSRTKIHKTKVSRSVQKLLEKGYIMRKTDEEDRRREHLELTTTGRHVYETLHDAAQVCDAQLSSMLTKKEDKFLRRALLKLAGMPKRDA